jgi:site-specific DNA recombinase
MQAIQYIRVSSDEQSKGGSLGAQTREGGEYLLRKNFDLIAAFRDVETAKSSGREDFSRMVAFLKKQKKPVALLVEKTDRLYRNHEDMVKVQHLVKAHGVEVHLYKEGEILSPATPSHTWLMHYFKVAMATNYVENLSEEIKKGRKEKLLKGGWPHKAPVGYRNEKKQIVIDEVTAPYVREAFALFASGLYSLDRTREELFKNGFRYRPTIPRMGKSAIAKMLKNPFYIGEMEVEGTIYPGTHPPLIDHNTWIGAKKAFRKDNKPLKFGTHDFKYQHILKCYFCGASMVGEEKKGGRYTYYRCARRKYGCDQGYISEAKLNKQFDAMVLSLNFPAEYKLAIIQAAAELDIPSQDPGAEVLKKMEEKRTRHRAAYKKALNEYLMGKIPEDIWGDMTQEYEADMRQIEAQSQQVSQADIKFGKTAKTWVELPETLEKRWPLGNAQMKLELLNFVGSNFKVEGEKLHYEWKEPFHLFDRKALCQAWWSMGDSNSRPSQCH